MIEEYQLDFFRDPEICRVESKLLHTAESLNKVRRGTFARINELKKELEELKAEHEWFKKYLCNQKSI